ncbi:MAG: hypothetical protein ACRDST_11540 [Pseudonocardiaceae bacterium]
MRVDEVEWDEGNLYHATLRVSAAEIEQVIEDPASIWRLNRKGRTATHLVSGRTTGGTAVRVAVLYEPATRTVRPITAVRIG